MTEPEPASPVRTRAYGQEGLSWVDRFGVYLSRRAVLRHLPARPGLAVLDAGCGYQAALLRGLRLRLARGLGVDLCIAPEARAEAGLSFHEGRLEEVLPALEPAQFDVVLLLSVLEHLAAPLAALCETHRLLKPGGVLLVNVPTWRGKWFLEFSAFRLGASPAAEMDDHRMYYDSRDLWPLLVRAGFRPSRIKLRRHKFGLNLFAVAHRE